MTTHRQPAHHEHRDTAPNTTSAIVATGIILVGLAIAVAIARPAAGPNQLSALAAIILGLVEGLTEFLPISSTGHLLVTQKLLGLGGTTQSDLALDSYAICIQAGAILAVLVLYRDRIRQLLAGAIGRDESGTQLLKVIIAAFVPTVAIALVLQDPVRTRLFGPGPVAVAWFVGGIAVLWLVRSGHLTRDGRPIMEMALRDGVSIGVAQALALWPGVSRSLVTIVAAVLLGMSLSAAVEFSFILGLVTLGAATGYEALSNGSNLIHTFGLANPIIGLVVAFLSALVAIRWMVAWLNHSGFAVFGWYRIAVGVAAALAMATGLI